MDNMLSQMLAAAEQAKKQVASDFVELWHAKPGKSVIRILPAYKKDSPLFFQPSVRHWIKIDGQNKPFVCAKESFGKKCEICEIIRNFKKKYPTSEKLNRQNLQKKKRFLINIIDRSDGNSYIAEIAISAFNDIIAIMHDPDYGNIVHEQNGHDVTVNRTGQNMTTKYQVIAKPQKTPTGDYPTPLPDLSQVYKIPSEDGIEEVRAWFADDDLVTNNNTENQSNNRTISNNVNDQLAAKLAMLGG